MGSNEKENVTVLITGNTAGVLAPPSILFPGQKMSPNVQSSIPDEYSAGYSEREWMTAENFYE